LFSDTKHPYFHIFREKMRTMIKKMMMNPVIATTLATTLPRYSIVRVGKFSAIQAVQARSMIQ